MEKLFYILLLGLFFVACSSDGSKIDLSRLNEFNVSDVKEISPLVSNDYIEFNLDTIENKGFAPASLLYQNRNYINLNTPDDVIIGKISQITRWENYLLVLDKEITKGVFLFDLKGNFLFRVGKEGFGPGEFSNPLAIFIRNSIIYVMDKTFVLHQYNLDNKHLLSEKIPFFAENFFISHDYNKIFTNNDLLPNALGYHVLGIRDNTITTKLIPVSGAALSSTGASPISNNPIYHHNSFLHAPSYSTQIYEINDNKAFLKYKIANEFTNLSEIFSSEATLFAREKDLTYLFGMPILESVNHLLFTVSAPGKFMTVIYNKDTKRTVGYSGMSDDLFFGALMFFPIYAYGEEFYTVLDPEVLISLKSNVEANPDAIDNFKLNNPETWRLIQNIDASSNPVIMVSELSIGEES